jgi:dTDP-4-dehydrorhamnose 3,5-epimerase
MSEVEKMEGVELFSPPMACADSRGLMWAWFDAEEVAGRGGSTQIHEGTVAVSNRGVIRGIHYARGRAKYVTCLSGAIYDVVVDLRRGSPTFGSWVSHELNEENRHAVYIGEGLGHGHQTLEKSTVAYLYTTPYVHDDYAAINPLDPALGISWPYFTRLLSHKDAAAPLLSAAPWLPEYEGAA